MMLRSYLKSGLRPNKKLLQLGQLRFASQKSPREEGPKLRHFAAIGVLGTVIFVAAVHKINEQDPSSSLYKRKNSFTEAEWEAQIKRKKLTFGDSGEEFYLIPYAPKSKSKTISEVAKKVTGGEVSKCGIIDLNDVIEKEMSNPRSTFGTLLKECISSEDLNNEKCHYEFTYKLANGIFTRLLKDEALRLKNENPELNSFLLLNYPNTVPEAVKFEQDVAYTKKLILLGVKGDEKNDIVDYFKTVDKVVSVKDL